MSDPARSRTWNLLIRSQTRYPLRHRTRLNKTVLTGLLILRYVSAVHLCFHSFLTFSNGTTKEMLRDSQSCDNHQTQLLRATVARQNLSCNSKSTYFLF